MIPIISRVNWRSLLPGQVSELCTFDMAAGKVRVIHRSSHAVLEAPNWTPDGQWLVVNSAGSLYRVAVHGGDPPERIPLGSLCDVNNDHVISPDGATIYVSSEGDGHVYSAPLSGGEPTRLSADRVGPFGYFVIGISPDGHTLAVTGAEAREGRDFVSSLFTMPAAGGVATPLPDDNSDGDSVGCAYSPDGAWLYFSSESGSAQRGRTQVLRMRPDGSGRQQLTDGASADWFPKPSPDGAWVVYLAFAPGTIGHASNVVVRLCAMRPDGSHQRTLHELLGGQGTMNVTSWSPKGDRFAFMAYPIGETP